ncbi:hypothetical protein HKD37_19G053910 [Glycine soja]
MQFMMELEIDLLALDQPESIDGFCALAAANVFFGLESLNDFLTQAATHRALHSFNEKGAEEIIPRNKRIKTLHAPRRVYGLYPSVHEDRTPIFQDQMHKYERSEGLNMSIQRCTLLSNCKSDIF